MRIRLSILLPIALGLASLVFTSSCELFERKVAVLWTDRGEFAAYVERFNQSQSRYKVEIEYRERPAKALVDEAGKPDIVVGSWLKSSSSRSLFRPLDYFFEDFLLSEASFYPRLLSLGFIEGRQYLLPVSFNIPAITFSKSNSRLVPDPFTLSLDEIKTLGKNYNQLEEGNFVRMGFSPRWDDEFLFVAATLFGASFKEGKPLAWDDKALEKAIVYLRDWSREANRSPEDEDDFGFKYLADPSQREVGSGRLLFALVQSDVLFRQDSERRDNLDFRWVSRDESIPLCEEATYLGLCKEGKAPAAADAFVQWLFKEENQKKLLEFSKETRLSDRVFGIANGFSSIRKVNEVDYPTYYPALLGHVPPSEYLDPPNILPRNWVLLKEKVLIPYLHERVRAASSEQTPGLKERILAFVHQNPTL